MVLQVGLPLMERRVLQVGCGRWKGDERAGDDGKVAPPRGGVPPVVKWNGEAPWSLVEWLFFSQMVSRLSQMADRDPAFSSFLWCNAQLSSLILSFYIPFPSLPCFLSLLLLFQNYGPRSP